MIRRYWPFLALAAVSGVLWAAVGKLFTALVVYSIGSVIAMTCARSIPRRATYSLSASELSWRLITQAGRCAPAGDHESPSRDARSTTIATR